MASKTYKARAIVLKKTKLGEKDLIITMLGENGMLMKAVAKGARKPGGSLAAKIELFSTIRALFAKGRSLDVMSETKLESSASAQGIGLEQSACASALAELLALIAQEDLEQPRLFDMAQAAFSYIAESEPADALAITAASLWKVLAQAGFRPHFESCVLCGAPVGSEAHEDRVLFSTLQGGSVCGICETVPDALQVDANAISWCTYLLGSRFDEIQKAQVQPDASFAVLALARPWIQVHVGKDLCSLDFLFTSALF